MDINKKKCNKEDAKSENKFVHTKTESRLSNVLHAIIQRDMLTGRNECKYI